MSTINLGEDFASAVLEHADLDAGVLDANTLAIDYIPTGGPATIRVTLVAQIDSAQLRQLVADSTTEQP